MKYITVKLTEDQHQELLTMVKEYPDLKGYSLKEVPTTQYKAFVRRLYTALAKAKS